MVGDNSLVHEHTVMEAVELPLNSTYYTRHPALKSVYEKSQLALGGKLFPAWIQKTYRAMSPEP